MEEESSHDTSSGGRTNEYDGQQRVDISTVTDVEFYGNKLNDNNKDSDVLRIGYLNVNGLPTFNNHPKNDALYRSMTNKKFDIVGFSEVNCNWSAIRQNNRWRERTRGWWETSHTSIGYNMNDCIRTTFQPGGTLLQSIDRAAHRVIKSGNDGSRLGRWSWTRFRGRHDITTTVICAYRPCRPSNNSGINTAFVQQQRAFDINNDNRNPRDAILEDLADFISTCYSNNDQIVLLMDCNEDVHSQTFQQWLNENRLTEIISHTHQGTIPPTYHRGSKQIDGIFTSHTLQPLRCGFLPFGELPSDHRTLWIDFSFDNFFGYKMPKLVVPRARRLKTDDPRVTKKWIDLYKNYIKDNDLHRRMFKIESTMMLPLPTHLANEYDNILNQRKQGIEYADKRCRKLRMGYSPCSPTLTKAGVAIELWKAVITKKQHASIAPVN